MMVGSTDIDAVTDSIDEQTFTRWLAAEEIGMFGHSERMLGFLCYMIANYMELKFDNSDDLRAITMPWSESQEVDPASAFRSLKTDYERAIQ